MTDITEGVAPNTAFAQAMAEAEARALAAEDAAQEQPRDDQGRFTSPEPAAAEETPAEGEVVAAEPTAAETLLAGKYKTAEELERGYLELQQFAARQGTDVGEQRALIQAYEERLAALEQRANQPAPQRITQDLIAEDPASATQLAYEQKDPTAVSIAYRQWAAEDPAAAATWYAEKRGEEREAALRAEFEAREKKLEERIAPIQAQNEQAQLAQSVAALPEDVRAFLTDAETVQQLASEFPTLGAAIVTGSASERINAIQALHGIHRGRTADTLNKAVTDVARTTAQEAQAVRDEAYVAQTGTSEAESLTWEQQQQQNAVAAFTRKASLWDEALVKPTAK